MRKILLSELRDKSVNRPKGYLDEIVSSGRVETMEIVLIDNDVYNKLVRKYALRAKPTEPISRDQWPTWAKVLAMKSTPNDKGIGDVVARVIGPEASGAFKAFYEMTFGKPCGCNGRQKLWNQKYPLNLKAT